MNAHSMFGGGTFVQDRASASNQILPTWNPHSSGCPLSKARLPARLNKFIHRRMQPVQAVMAPEKPALRPDANGRFGKFGGKYVPETLIAALAELEKEYEAAKNDPEFQAELDSILKDYVGRESPLYHAERLSEQYRRPDGSRPEIYLKREDLNHTGAHKINNSLGQVLLCLRMNKKRIIAETGAGQHGVATATVCAKFGLPCIIYMGSKDMERQSLNVFRMRLMGAEVRPVNTGTATLKDATSEAIRDWVTNVESTHYILGSAAGPHPYPMLVRPVNTGTATLKDATSEAIRDWVTNVESTHYILGSAAGPHPYPMLIWASFTSWVTTVESADYILGSAAGPHPYPMLVRDFQAVIGRETRRQCLEQFGGKPDILLACVGGGSNAIGLFHEFVDDEEIRLIGVEAGGEGVETDKHAATLTKGSPGVLHGSFSYLLQDSEGQIIDPHSISAGLDYPGIGPEHSYLKDLGRAEYHAVTDAEALDAFQRVCRLEGIIPALETSHAFAYLDKLCPTLPNGTRIVINCSGRGDKDVNTAAKFINLTGSDASLS